MLVKALLTFLTGCQLLLIVLVFSVDKESAIEIRSKFNSSLSTISIVGAWSCGLPEMNNVPSAIP